LERERTPARRADDLSTRHPGCEQAGEAAAATRYQAKKGMRPKELVRTWVKAFNARKPSEIAALYHEDAINHQVAQDPVEGRAAIGAMFAREFAAADMVCIVEDIFEDGDVAILEWRDPLGLRGCGIFHVRDGKIAFQRGSWDKLSFLRLHGLPID
jgi:limonene-1,2-epoxide hydrolase